MLNEFPDNPLVYLCKNCKPVILPPSNKLNIIAKKIEDAFKTKIRNIREEHNKPLDFLVNKSNSIEATLQSLKQLVSHLNPYCDGDTSEVPVKSWASRVASNEMPAVTQATVTPLKPSIHSVVIYNIPPTVN
jgi:UDP:flavonoid glycosyltransferase YjiC (YdhE family)